MDIVNGYRVEQSVGANQPKYFTDVPRLTFDGTNDRLMHVDNQIRDFSRNTNVASVYAVVRNTNRLGGTNVHPILQSNFSAPPVGVLFSLRHLKTGLWACAGRRVANETTFTIASAASADGWHVVAGKHLYSSGVLSLRINGAQADTTNFQDAGVSDSEDISATRVGSDGLTIADQFFPGDMAGIIIVRGSADISATDQNRIERYLGLLAGLDIPLV